MSKLAFIKELSLPVVAAPMFLISGPDLVIECCKNGIIGTFPALNQRSSEGFEEWLNQIKQQLQLFEQESGKKAAPYGVNLILHPSNPRLKQDLQLCIKHQVPLIITSLGVDHQVVDAIHAYGGLVFHDVINRRHAEKAASGGVDGLILVSAGAGGHGGTINPISLVSEIKSFFDKTLLLSGCISNGQDIASALQMGADLAYMGTRFINTRESMAPTDYRKMIIDSDTADIVYTAAVSGVKANFMRQSLLAMGITQEMWDHQGKMDFADEMGEAKAWKTIWSAGQGVNSIHDDIPVTHLVTRLKSEFHAAINRQAQLLNTYAN